MKNFELKKYFGNLVVIPTTIYLNLCYRKWFEILEL